ncbi:MAG: type II toxin-antitoxin system VapC family toxin [Limisphaerales bacterium]
MTYFDTSVLVGALLQTHPNHKECLAIFEQTRERITCAHALAEVFSTLTAHYKVPNEAAAEITLSLLGKLTVEPLSLRDYETAIAEARQRGVMGGGIYDSLHATYARHHSTRRVITRNPGNFHHVAPDMEIVVP